jgi:DNA-directed RNA polymerase subunit L
MIQSLGVFSNDNLMLLALKQLEIRANKLIKSITDGEIELGQSLSTIPNSYDIVFEDDYTIGKVLEFILSKKDLTYCGYTKNHPHDIESIIRIAFHSKVSKITTELISNMLRDALHEAIEIFVKLSKLFLK